MRSLKNVLSLGKGTEGRVEARLSGALGAFSEVSVFSLDKISIVN